MSEVRLILHGPAIVIPHRRPHQLLIALHALVEIRRAGLYQHRQSQAVEVQGIIAIARIVLFFMPTRAEIWFVLILRAAQTALGVILVF